MVRRRFRALPCHPSLLAEGPRHRAYRRPGNRRRNGSEANLTPGGRSVLDGVIAILRENPGRVEISGHTDAQGATDHNLDLSRRRAETVQSYFIAKGLNAKRFEVVGYGSTRPIASNASAEGQQMNRRTEFHALKEN
ncbi:MAG: OmpA family protein [Acidobacteria bacterium]|nr:OmpA family protein [Candidatus Sulfomarinibacter kjeldsenii]